MGIIISQHGWLEKPCENLPFGRCYTVPSYVYENKQGTDVKKVDPVRNVVVELEKAGRLVKGVGIGKQLRVGVVAGLQIEIAFAIVSGEYYDSISRSISNDVKFITIKAITLLNHWGFALSVDNNGHISHSNKDRNLDTWQGWVIESLGDKRVFLSRSAGHGSIVLAIDDSGKVCTTKNRSRNGWEELEMTFHKSNRTLSFERVKEPRYILACTDKGHICTTQNLNIHGWEVWIPH